MRKRLTIPKRTHDGQFDTFDIWYAEALERIAGTNSMCADAAERICASYADMLRARDESTVPVRYWHGAGGQTRAEQARMRKLVWMEKNGFWPAVLF
jgi:hypothetical protein